MHGSMLKAANEYMVRCLYLRMPMLMNVITYEHEWLCLLDGWMVLNNYGYALNYAILLLYIYSYCFSMLMLILLSCAFEKIIFCE